MLEFVQLRCNSDLQKKETEKCAASEVSRVGNMKFLKFQLPLQSLIPGVSKKILRSHIYLVFNVNNQS